MNLPPRLTVVTLGVRDIDAVSAFYEALGWAVHRVGDESARFDMAGAMLTLYRMDLLAADAQVEPPPAGAGFSGMNLAVNVETRDAVDAAFDTVRAAGGTVLAEPVDRDWGGRSGYFADPEGNVWEVAWMPGSTFSDEPAMTWS